eukprot:1386122-Prymnesium_polylepis.1
MRRPSCKSAARSSPLLSKRWASQRARATAGVRFGARKSAPRRRRRKGVGGGGGPSGRASEPGWSGQRLGPRGA